MTGFTAAQIGIPASLFFLTLIASSSLDLSVSLSFAVYLILTKRPYIPIFGLSLFLLLLGFTFDFFDISLRLVTDLSLDGYLFFLSGLILYIRTNEQILGFIKNLFPENEKIISRSLLMKLGGGFVLTLLLFPLFGGYISAVSGYILISFLSPPSSGKIAFHISLIFLLITAVFYSTRLVELANELVNYTYLFLIIGLVQEAINSLGLGKILVKIKNRSDRISVNKPLVIFPFVLLLILSGGYFAFRNYKPVNNSKSAVPSPYNSPTSIPPAPATQAFDETEMASLAASLRVSVQNGTTISGLAASTAAVLNKAGFGEIKIGNAQTQDYKTSEIFLKNRETKLLDYLKKLLNLEVLKINDATSGAKYDIVIIVGEEKK